MSVPKTASNGRENNLHLASFFRFACAVDHFRLGAEGETSELQKRNLQKVELIRQVKERVVIPVATSHL